MKLFLEKKLFIRILIIIQLIFIAILWLILSRGVLVGEPAKYQKWFLWQPLTTIENVENWIGLIGEMILVISSIGLLIFKNWARIGYTIAIPLCVLTQYTTTPFLVWGWQMILSDLITLCLGVIVTVIWSKPINSLFKEES